MLDQIRFLVREYVGGALLLALLFLIVVIVGAIIAIYLL